MGDSPLLSTLVQVNQQERQEQILETMTNANGTIELQELVELLQLSPYMIRNDLSTMKQRGLVTQRGRGPATRWVLIEK